MSFLAPFYLAGILAFVVGTYALVVIWYPDANWSEDAR